MCGIAGVIAENLSAAERSALVTHMCRAMVHRGPDDEGIRSSDPATLGMRRLAIFDPKNGRQPMHTPDGRITLVFNGAIYNFRALQAELASSWTFRTTCDTEVLLAAFARWGEDCLPRLRGMFAFAAWDAAARRLFLARDPFGIKPLYLQPSGNRLAFASELNALALAAPRPLEVDPEAAADFLAWQAVPAPRTIYRGVISLQPGECASFCAGQLTRRVYWRFPAAEPNAAVGDPAEFPVALRAQLEDTLAAHCLADVPVGAFLSGGLDSAVVAGLMARKMPGRLKTFSIGFDESAYTEAEAAAGTARCIGSEHHTTIVRGSQVADDIGRIVASLDHPTGDGINTYYVSRAARAGGVTVALSGLGGDELFGGYPSFRNVSRLLPWLQRWRRLPPPVARVLATPLPLAGVRGEKLADLVASARDRHALAAAQRRVLSDRQLRRLFRTPPSPIAHPQLNALRENLGDANPFATASAWELRGYMADLLLRDSDMMSMAHSLELRVPFVDRPFVEWLWRQPTAWRNTPHQPKSVLATAARDVLPPELLTRAKRGFTFPFPLWMRRELRPWLDATLSTENVRRSGLLDPAGVAALCQPFLAGRDDRAWSRVWSTAMLVAFVNRGAPRPAPAA
jgi:asparagine synthase (glutamine-hydrolysing)